MRDERRRTGFIKDDGEEAGGEFEEGEENADFRDGVEGTT